MVMAVSLTNSTRGTQLERSSSSTVTCKAAADFVATIFVCVDVLTISRWPRLLLGRVHARGLLLAQLSKLLGVLLFLLALCYHAAQERARAARLRIKQTRESSEHGRSFHQPPAQLDAPACGAR